MRNKEVQSEEISKEKKLSCLRSPYKKGTNNYGENRNEKRVYYYFSAVSFV